MVYSSPWLVVPTFWSPTAGTFKPQLAGSDNWLKEELLSAVQQQELAGFVCGNDTVMVMTHWQIQIKQGMLDKSGGELFLIIVSSQFNCVQLTTAWWDNFLSSKFQSLSFEIQFLPLALHCPSWDFHFLSLVFQFVSLEFDCHHLKIWFAFRDFGKQWGNSEERVWVSKR